MSPRVIDTSSLQRPEIQLILACIGPNLAWKDTNLVAALAGRVVDWNLVYDLARTHGVRPLVHRTIIDQAPHTIPTAIEKRFRIAKRYSVAQSLVLSSHLLRVSSIFRENGVTLAAFKGPFLSDCIYHDPALRESQDLDLVVHKRHIMDARDALIASEYREIKPFGGTAHESAQLHAPRYNKFAHADSGVTIDLQSSLEAPHFSFPLDDETLWRNLIDRDFAGQPLSTFETDDMLILLCVHGTKDLWAKLKWISDIAELIHDNKGLNWTRLIRRARQLKARRKLLLGIALAHHVLKADIPAFVSKTIAKEQQIILASNGIINRILSDNDAEKSFARVDLYLWTDDTFIEQSKRICYYLRRYWLIIFSPTEVDLNLVSLPKYLSFLYYFIRPIRLLVKHSLSPRKMRDTMKEWFDYFG